LLVAERRARPAAAPVDPQQAARLSAGQALLMGIGQALAILPGLSRSGTTLSFGLLARLDRADAANFAFLMAIPAIGGAFLLTLGDLAQTGSPLEATLRVGGAAAAGSGGGAIQAPPRRVQRGRRWWWPLDPVRRRPLRVQALVLAGLLGALLLWAGQAGWRLVREALVRTVPVQASVVERRLPVEAWVLRREWVRTAGASGYLVPLVQGGQHVHK